MTKAKNQQRSLNEEKTKRHARDVRSDGATYTRAAAIHANTPRNRYPSMNAIHDVPPSPPAEPEPLGPLPDLPAPMTQDKVMQDLEFTEEETTKSETISSAAPPTTRVTRAKASEDAQDSATPSIGITRARSKKGAPPPANLPSSRHKRAAALKSETRKPVGIVESPKPATKFEEKKVAQGRITKAAKRAVKGGKSAAKPQRKGHSRPGDEGSSDEGNDNLESQEEQNRLG
jgi:hypothetical protein